jgi:hypothetical protein
MEAVGTSKMLAHTTNITRRINPAHQYLNLRRPENFNLTGEILDQLSDY